MRPAAQGARSAIDRVFTQPMVPARRFHGALDAALTLALGSICAFGLTLGPAPLNTVALSATAPSSAHEILDLEPDLLLAPDDGDNEFDSDADSADSAIDPAGASFRPRLPASSEHTEPQPVAQPTASAAPRHAGSRLCIPVRSP